MQPWAAVAALAFVCTALNALKPLNVDDAAYYYFAAQIADNPADPYGFDVFWYERPEPANSVLAPPVLPYWWAAGIRLFGERPFCWKLWLFPFSLLFAISLYALFRRFAPGFEFPLTVFTLFSPTFLPSLNLMLDVPALALGLAALNVFWKACDTNSLGRALLAGLLSGLAMQTKYTGILAPPVMLLYSLTFSLADFRSPLPRRFAALRLAAVAALFAFLLFTAWETYIAWRYGESHFLGQWHHQDNNPLEQLSEWFLPLVVLLGGVNGGGLLLALAALGKRARLIGSMTIALALGLALVAHVGGDAMTDWLPGLSAFQSWQSVLANWTVEAALFALFGLVAMLALARVACRLLCACNSWLALPRWRGRPTECFLVLWLALEMAGYFALTPFGAVRRIMGIVVVATALTGRLATFTCRSPERRGLIWLIAAANAGLGFLFYVVDFRDAMAWKQAAEGSAAYIRERNPKATIWYVGHWGFQYYAERSGLVPLIANDHRHPLRQGDWIIVPDDRLNQQEVMIDGPNTKFQIELIWDDWLPFCTVQGFYGTSTGVPLEQRLRPRVAVDIYHVTTTFVPPRH
jgi:hypothetical protein